MSSRSYRYLLLVALVALGSAAGCIVRTHPSHGHSHYHSTHSHSPGRGHKHGHHKHHKVKRHNHR